MTARRLVLTIALVLAFGQSAQAQNLLEKNVHYFLPVVDDSGIIWTYGSAPLGMGRMHYGLYADDAVAPVARLRDNGEIQHVVQNQVGAQLLYSVGLFHIANLGFAAPLIPYRQINGQFEDDFKLDQGLETFAMEDLRFDSKFTILNRRQKCLGVAALFRVGVPISGQENSFASDAGVTLHPALIVDLGRRWWTVTTNLGYKYYVNPGDSELFNLTVGDEISFNLGSVFRVSRSQQVLLDSATRTQVATPFGEPDLDYSEILVAYRKYWQRLNFTALTVGVGAGLLSGVGDPTVRFFIGVTRDERRTSPGDVVY
ncbi:MAG: hypothetical protein P9L99_07185 [Candidatus Lernaella stagnicola]|nr:hypothetical protein [Candidatus Lernaella stagnicola]